MWTKIDEMAPKKGKRIITRSPGYKGIGDSIESWREYKIMKLNPPLTHWWNGEYDFDLAVDKWYENKEEKEKN
jgi:hypothetical protein